MFDASSTVGADDDDADLRRRRRTKQCGDLSKQARQARNQGRIAGEVRYCVHTASTRRHKSSILRSCGMMHVGRSKYSVRLLGPASYR